MHWTLDYDRKSDTKDMVGYWRVEQISTNPLVTRVDYATEMLVTGVPDFLSELPYERCAYQWYEVGQA